MNAKIISKDRAFPSNNKQLAINLYPDEVLLQTALAVTDFGRGLKELCSDMLLTMYRAPGIGLAAPQVGLNQRIFVCDVEYERRLLDAKGREIETDENAAPDAPKPAIAAIELCDLEPLIFINPELVDQHGRTTYDEGCLSLPGVFDTVERHKEIELRYQDVKGKFHYKKVGELLSICCQHELDHLNGILFIQRLVPEKFELHHQQFLAWRKEREL